MKLTIFLAILVITISCQSTKEIMDSWIGASKQDLIMSWGPPQKVIENSPNGTILVYQKRVYVEPGQPYPGVYTKAEHYWQYKYMYVGDNGTIFHWRRDREIIPPEQIELNIRKDR
jgi:hypothetical protein